MTESRELSTAPFLPPPLVEKQFRHSLSDLGISHVQFVIESADKKYCLTGCEDLRHDHGERVSFNQSSNLLATIPDNFEAVAKETLSECCDVNLGTGLTHYQYKITKRIVHQYRAHFIFSSDSKLNAKEHKQLQAHIELVIAWANFSASHHHLIKQWDLINDSNFITDSLLTASELAVFQLLISGCTGSQIAQIRQVSKETVRTQIKSILHKTDCNSQNQLISRYGYSQWLTEHARFKPLTQSTVTVKA
ncbi:helix-turn-helix transcriptional regulator [Vibrio hippocampi]|uniref:HTH luxR-type domain-containing protein n=1 Tax=Vibrio hippocampi TaxID=654686 RepID=A0ABM8ZMZ4_9VIBR|nr:helix-turn-helix transcriptional regulator [Vibrio hippocampi]CAH0529597.1 hypothetical protein VHP8226_03352 [Vibrio hippocampi]